MTRLAEKIPEKTMEERERLAALEIRATHTDATLTRLETKLDRVIDKLDALKDSLFKAKVWAVLLYVALAATLLGVIAKGFHWI